MLTCARNGETRYSIQKCKVISVGRKYVKASSQKFLTKEFLETGKSNCEYLIENKDWGNIARLFLTEQAAQDAIEREALINWLRKATVDYAINKYTLEQLRGVKKILGGEQA